MSESSLKEKSPKEAHDRLDAYHVIDVRFEHEVEGGPLGAVEGAERIDRVDLEERIHDLKDKELLVVCRSGRRSAAACEALMQLGHGDVTNLEGGMIAWNEAGLPVERKRSKSVSELVHRITHWFSMLAMKPHEEARTHLGVDEGDDHVHGDVHRALEAATEHLGGDTAPPDLARSVDVFRSDLDALADGADETKRDEA